MSDDLKRAKDAFGLQEPVSPREAARKAALHASMEQFEKNNSAVQGSVIGARLKEWGRALLTAFTWRRLMTFVQPRLAHVLAGGVSLAAIALVVNINHIALDLPNFFDDAKTEAETPVVDVEGQQAVQAPDTMLAAAPEPMPEPVELDVVAEVVAPSGLGGLVSAAPPAPGITLHSAPQGLTGAKPMAARRALTKNNGAMKSLSMPAPADAIAPAYQDQGRDKFTEIEANPVQLVVDDPVSTFSVDVDTASYGFVRAALNRGVLPQKDAVRVEELINYFDYDYAGPTDKAVPFRANVAMMPTPWNDNSKLLRIGIKGYDLAKSEVPSANLVFLIDTSGSMNAPDKLPLLRNAFKLLVSNLKADDTVSIVAYAGSAGTVLEPTKASDAAKIMAALDRLSAGGSTAGGEGIRQAYQLAESSFDKDGVNRVILATDGDFNVGIDDPEELKGFVERKRKSGVSLSVLGFGQGNYNDELMQALAQNGNGNAAYIDTLNEARKVLVEEAGSTLFTIAKDVKLQLEFNPAQVSDYRLIGYETRQLKRQDFANDKVDAGDIGSGHTVTALYELTLKGAKGSLIAPLRYQAGDAKPAQSVSDEFGFLKIRYKQPDSDTSELITTPIKQDVVIDKIEDAPADMRFAASVAAFGQLLRGGEHTGDFTYDDVIELAQNTKGADRFNYRGEFLNLVRLAKSAAALDVQKP